ncbi:MAG: SHOCT-like domain-containing protein [Anaerolineae bacterium]|jgi:hypothetical protein
MENERLEILKMLEAGQIDAQEAASLLAALAESEAAEDAAESPAEGLPSDREPPEPMETRWARFWIYPMMAGGAILLLGALIVGLVSLSGGAWGWLLCGWPLLLLGLLVLVLALWSRSATWMHLRISEQGRRKMAFSFPVPLGLAAWAIRIAQPFVPQLRDTGVDEVILAVRDSASRGEPLFIDVQDDEDGERVELYIG